jgi:GTPase SAR1 family protein
MSLLIVGAPKSGKTSLVSSLLLSHPTKKNPNHPRYFYGFFDDVYIISGSCITLPLDDFDLDPTHVFDEYSEETLQKIIGDLKEGPNGNSLIWIDDCIDDLKVKDRTLTHAILNRRHITQNDDDDTRAELSIWITTQKFNLFPLRYRTAVSAYIIFPTTNNAELQAIKNELLGDLTKDQQDAVLDTCWAEPHSFLFVNTQAPKGKRLYCKFDRLEID